MRSFTDIKKPVFLILLLTHSVYISFAQNGLTVRPSAGLQNVYARTVFPGIKHLNFRNNVFDEHFYMGIEVNWSARGNGFLYLLAETRLGGYSFSARYYNNLCPQRISSQSLSEAYSFTAWGAGYGHLIKKKKAHKGITSALSASAGLAFLVNNKNNPVDETIGTIICDDEIFYSDIFLRSRNTGIGLQTKLYLDLYSKKRAILSISISWQAGIRRITYDQLVTKFNADIYANTFISKGSGFTAAIGYPFTFFRSRRH